MKYRLALILIFVTALYCCGWYGTKRRHLSPVVRATTETPLQAAVREAPREAKLVHAARPLFSETLQQILTDIPTHSILNEGKRDLTRPPRELAQIAVRMGQALQDLRSHPELLGNGISFFYACAKKEEALTAVRAFCLHHLVRLQHEVNTAVFNESEFPIELRQIAEHLGGV